MRIGFDFDGVLCQTPFGRLAVHAPRPVPPLPDGYERLYAQPRPPRPLRLALEYARFAWRTTAPDAVAVLTRIARSHDVYIVTGRSWVGEPLVRRWLRRHRLDTLVRDVRMAPPGLRPSQHKLAAARMLRLDVQIDDDPRTAYHLAREGVPAVYLYDHAGAHGDAAPPPRLVLVRTLPAFADAVCADGE